MLITQGPSMGAGGTAPKMKMSDAFILTGLTVLLGGLFMHGWVTPVAHASEDEPYTSGASMMKGDSFRLEIKVENETVLRVSLKDDTGDVLNVTTTVLAADEVHLATLTVDESGFYSYEIDTRNTAATISVDIERKTKLDMIFLPMGVLILAMGVYQRLATKDDEVLDAELDA